MNTALAPNTSKTCVEDQLALKADQPDTIALLALTVNQTTTCNTEADSALAPKATAAYALGQIALQASVSPQV